MFWLTPNQPHELDSQQFSNFRSEVCPSFPTTGIPQGVLPQTAPKPLWDSGKWNAESGVCGLPDWSPFVGGRHPWEWFPIDHVGRLMIVSYSLTPLANPIH
ncbi:MAG: hypothetical protein LC104_20220 [Bacteroidales bacterium]|nr:hypothetical protein [Bacteroidales bacterium]